MKVWRRKECNGCHKNERKMTKQENEQDSNNKDHKTKYENQNSQSKDEIISEEECTMAQETMLK